MMKPVSVMQVVEALESGKYEQARNVLHSTSGGFCCLGVGLDLAGCEWLDEGQEGYATPSGTIGMVNTDDAYQLGEWGAFILQGDGFGFSLMDEDLANEESEEGGMRWTLAQMNDEGYSFTEIAQYIKSRYLLSH